MECLAVKVIQPESHHFFHDKICRRQWVLVFLVLVVLHEKMNFKFEDLSFGRWESEKGQGQKASSCNNVCRVCLINLNGIYGKCVSKACGNIFKLSARKESFGVVLSKSLKSFGITLIASYRHRFAVGLQCLFMFQLTHKPLNCY